MTVTLTRNPNLSTPTSQMSFKNEIKESFGSSWWTGLHPSQCKGYDPRSKTLHALPLLNLQICTKEDVLDYFNNTWALTEVLFSGLKTEATFWRPPYHGLRHPLIFYYGHTAVVCVNKLRLAGLIQDPIDTYLEKILEIGVDEMSWDDMSKNEMAWPTVLEVHSYRKKVYDLIKNIILGCSDFEKEDKEFLQTSPLWALWMGFEHEKIHFETSSVLIRELPIEFVEKPDFWPSYHESSINKSSSKPEENIDYPKNKWTHFSGGVVEYGKPLNTPSFGWDNEYGHRKTNIQDFQTTEYLISNGEYYEFVATHAYSEDKHWKPEGLQWRKYRNSRRPTFWMSHGPEGLHDYKLRMIFEIIPMPWSWPVEVNFHEAQAFCHWKQEKDNSHLTYRLLTEAEHKKISSNIQIDPVLQHQSYCHWSLRERNLEEQFNFNFRFSSPSPVNFNKMEYHGKDLSDLYGNVWQWLEDQFNPLEQFKTHPFYEDFSTPCFDGQHQMILGGSFISCGHEASLWARFHFRPHFFQHSGFRISASLNGSADNGSVKLKTSDYIHRKREDCLDQIKSNTDWWKNIYQPLELNAEENKDNFNITEKFISKYLSDLNQLNPAGTALNPKTGSLKSDFKVPYQSTKTFPARSSNLTQLLDTLFSELVPTGQIPGHPGYAGYVSGAGNPISALSHWISDTINPFTGHYSISPALVNLENEAMEWLIQMIQFPSTAWGYFTSGSSLAVTHALSLALYHKRNAAPLEKCRFYASSESHQFIGKALTFLGLEKVSLCLIPTDSFLRLNVDKLKSQILEDQQNGLTPIAIIATAGTTNTGSIDPISEIVKISQKENIWLHIDGAYGLPFLLTEKGSQLLKDVNMADSVNLDLHKSFSLPFGTGSLILKDRSHFRVEKYVNSTYMPQTINNLEVPDISDISMELSREFRGFRFWLPLKYFGVGPFKLNLEEKIKLSEYAHNELNQIKHLKIFSSSDLSILTFSLNKDSFIEGNNESTKKILEKINSTGKYFLSSCRIENYFCIRICMLGYRMHFEQINNLIELIKNES